jgi:hypothetical protein
VAARPSKGRLMDEILDAEYKVVGHQIAPPLDVWNRKKPSQPTTHQLQRNSKPVANVLTQPELGLETLGCKNWRKTSSISVPA